MKGNQNPVGLDDNSSNDDYSSTPTEKIGLKTHAPDGWQEIISPQELQRLVKSGDQVGLHVLVGDIRKSTFLMKESISSKRFAIITRDLMKAVKDADSKNDGWFDKFTGDGFIIYWIYGDETNQQKYVPEMLSFCDALFSIFPEVMDMNTAQIPQISLPISVSL
jgi:hypothetical protein